MVYINKYFSPLGIITIACDDEYIIGLWFDNQKYFGSTLSKNIETKSQPLFKEVEKWLDIYFSGRKPDFFLPIRYGSTRFSKMVYDILLTIPYGKTITYGEISIKVAKTLGKEKMSAQAIGMVVGHNPISLIIPCHRVIGKNGNLTGYAGGIERKIKLLELEKVDTTKFFYTSKKEKN